MGNFIRIVMIVISCLFGFVNSFLYLLNEIHTVSRLDNLDDYFNILGMITVVLSLVIVATNIPSIICQVKIIRYKRSIKSSDLIDDRLSDRLLDTEKKLPSMKILTMNIVFSFTFTLYYIYVCGIGLFTEETSTLGLIFLIFFIFLAIGGIVMFIDAIKFQKLRALRE